MEIKQEPTPEQKATIKKLHNEEVKKSKISVYNQIKSTAKPTFNKLRLFTDNPAAGLFYEAAGFKKTDGHKVSHELTLYMT
jgi:hypothetical protein